MRCKHPSCNSDAELRATGFSSPHPILYCPICKSGVWVKESGVTDMTGKLVKHSITYQYTPLDGSSVEDWLKKHNYWWR
jgi:hypothetical protein